MIQCVEKQSAAPKVSGYLATKYMDANPPMLAPAIAVLSGACSMPYFSRTIGKILFTSSSLYLAFIGVFVGGRYSSGKLSQMSG